MRFLKQISFDEKGLAAIIESGKNLVLLNFRSPLVWQCVDESATLHKEEFAVSEHEYEFLSKSNFLDNAVEEFGEHARLNNQKIKHFRVLTIADVIEVISSKNPVVIEVEAELTSGC